MSYYNITIEAFIWSMGQTDETFHYQSKWTYQTFQTAATSCISQRLIIYRRLWFKYGRRFMCCKMPILTLDRLCSYL